MLVTAVGTFSGRYMQKNVPKRKGDMAVESSTFWNLNIFPLAPF